MVGLGCIRRQGRAGEDRAEKEPGAEIAADEVCVLALPTEAGLLGERLFHQRGSVDEDFHIRAGECGDLAGELFEAGLDEVVRVPPPRVYGDVADLALDEGVEGVVVRTVIHRDDEGRAGLRPHRGRRAAAGERVFQPAHLAMAPLGDKVRKAGAGLPGLVGAGDASRIKTERASGGFHC